MPDVPVYALVNLAVTDAAVYRQYKKGFFPLLKKYGGLVTYDDAVFTLEGTLPRRHAAGAPDDGARPAATLSASDQPPLTCFDPEKP